MVDDIVRASMSKSMKRSEVFAEKLREAKHPDEDPHGYREVMDPKDSI